MARTSNKITVTCTRTGLTKTGTPDQIAEFFYRDKSTSTGFSPWCKDAEREYNQAYRAGLSKANAPRKADADTRGVATFEATMKSMGVRTPRGSKKARAATSPRASSKKRTTARKSARSAKRNAA